MAKIAIRQASAVHALINRSFIIGTWNCKKTGLMPLIGYARVV